MGMTNVQIKIKNPQNPKQEYQGRFLVDSGATYTVVPASILKRIGIKPQRVEEFSLADGSMIKRKVGSAMYEFQGKESAAPILFGEKGDSLLLGAFTLEALGLTLNPLSRTLHQANLSNI